MKKNLSPAEIAEKNRMGKYSMSLSKTNMDKIKAEAAKHKIPYSNIVDEAIAQYLKGQKNN